MRGARLMSVLKRIPVYPESVAINSLLPGFNFGHLPSDAPLCEDDRSRVSWVSAERRDEYLRRREGVEDEED